MTRIYVFVLICFLAAPVFCIAEDQAEKIKELELKIEQLQKQLDELRSGGETSELAEIRRQLTVLADELEKMRSGEEEVELEAAERQSLGLGSAAATIYTRKRGVSLAGYGEALYENFSEETDLDAPSGRIDQVDFLRAVIYFGYRFNDRFLFNSEIEFEHASTGEGGEVSVEFAYVDFRATENGTVRGGLVLLPMGFVNEFHEPTAFLGARRPVTETVIIPSTWRENGVGFLGRAGIIDYRAYVINGLNAARFSSSGIRDGRQDGARAEIKSPSFVGRADVSPIPGLLAGVSFYAGDSIVFGTVQATDLEIPTLIWEAHGEYKIRGFDLRGLYARASLDDVAELNAVLGLTGNSSIGETLNGGYFQAGYDILAGRNSQHLTPYFRYEKVDTQADVPAGFVRNPARDQTILTLGLEYRPIWNLVIKADYQNIDNESETGVDQFNLLLGYSF